MRIDEIVTEDMILLEASWKQRAGAAAMAGMSLLGTGERAQAQQQSYSQPPAASASAEDSSEKLVTSIIFKCGILIQKVKKLMNDPDTDMKKLTSDVDGFANQMSSMAKKAKDAGQMNDEQFNQIKNNLDYLVSLTQSEKKDYKQNQAPSASQSPKAPDTQQSVKRNVERLIGGSYWPSKPDYILAFRVGELSALMNNPKFRSMISPEQKQIYNDGYSALQSTWGKFSQSDNQELESRWKDGVNRTNRGTLNDFLKRAKMAEDVRLGRPNDITWRDDLDRWLDNQFGTHSGKISSGGVRMGANGYR